MKRNTGNLDFSLSSIQVMVTDFSEYAGQAVAIVLAGTVASLSEKDLIC